MPPKLKGPPGKVAAKASSRKRTAQEDLSANDTARMDAEAGKSKRQKLPAHDDEISAQSDSDSDHASGRLARKGNVSNGLDRSLPPVSSVDVAFKDMVDRHRHSLDLIAKHGGFRLRIATMCSGTEAPIFAMQMLQDFYSRSNPGLSILNFDHVFSAEIEAFKQAYIARNTEGGILFGDITNFVSSKDGKAPTAMGAMETIPGDIDLLISGCSCVEFSTLNTGKKQNFTKTPTDRKASNDDLQEAEKRLDEQMGEIDSMGSSGKTFFSMLHYVRVYKPKMVILENVSGAPWKDIEKKWFPLVGYTAAAVKLDTKDYYIPQTRQRGYLIALSGDAFGKDMAQRIINDWRGLVKKLGRRASSPVVSWLLPPAHPLTERARQDDSEKALMPRKADSDWQRSRARHARVRKQEGLADDRPLTQWGSTNMRKRPYDRMDRLVLLTQPDRVLDCIEIFYLRGLKLGVQVDGRRHTFDMKFKSRIYDLSQNIDRNLGSMPLGMTGCITPSGIHWVTDQNRVLSGYETLLLQGLPLSRLNFSTETQDNLRDLAGNAMSTTVVGAAIMAALIAIDKHCGKTNGKAKSCIGPLSTTNPRGFPPRNYYYTILDLKSIPEFSTMAALPINASILKRLYRRCRRYCFCNRAAKYSTEDFNCCSECSTVRCKWCAGNPDHYPGTVARPLDFLLLSEVEHEVMSYLPSTIVQPIMVDSMLNERLFPGPAVIMNPAVMKSLRSTIFYYQHIHVTEVVTVCYAAEGGLELRAVLSQQGFSWYLYLDPWGALGTRFLKDHKLQAGQLAQPVAWAKVPVDSRSTLPTNGSWQFWCFKSVRFEARVLTTSVKDQLEIDDITIGKMEDNFGFPAQTEEDLCSVIGTYKHRPRCDAPEGSLYKHTRPGSKLFLFKDTTKTGMPNQDSWVISLDCRPLETHEYREVVLKFEADVDLRNLTGDAAKAVVDGFWVTPSISKIQLSPNPYQNALRQIEMLRVPASKSMLILPNDSAQCVFVDACVVRHSECDEYDIITKYQHLTAEDDVWVTPERFEIHHFYDFISYFNVKVASMEDLKIRFEMVDLDAYADPEETKSPCEGLPPLLPQIQWIRVGSKWVAHHHSKDMATFEGNMKNELPKFGLAARVVPNPDVPRDMYTICIRYLINSKALAYKAISYLPPRKEDEARIEAYTEVEINAVTAENLRINSALPQEVASKHTFEPFRKSLHKLEGEPLVDDARISSFRARLSESQMRSLGWMLSRERDTPAFYEQETDEWIEPNLKLRLVGRAQRKICRRGGVLADDVGYGKTVVTLALIHCQKHFDETESMELRVTDSQHYRHLKATLIVVPPHLVDQWAEQAAKFLPSGKSHIVKIKTMLCLKDDDKLGVLKRLENARLIIVSNDIFGQPEYHLNLAKHSGCLDPSFEVDQGTNKNTCKGRAFYDWYRDALSTAPEYTSRLLALGEQPLDKTNLGNLRRDIEKSLESRFELRRDFLDDYKRRRANTMSGSKTTQKKSAKDKKTDEDSIEELSEPTCKFGSAAGMFVDFAHILEGFSFARVVYDEFSYDNFAAALFVRYARAHSKWVLSATPPTRNLAAVCGIADLMDIHIARPMRRRLGLPRITKGPELVEQSNAERLLSHNQISSDQLIRERHEKGREFLREFSKSNPLDRELAGGVKVEEKVIVSEMSRRESLHYLDMQQELRACGFDADLLPGKSRDLLFPVVGPQWNGNGRAIGGQALLLRASLKRPDTKEYTESYLLEHRRFLLRNALNTLKINAEKAIWLCNRIANNQTEYGYENARGAIGDVCTLLREIWQGDVAQCGGLQAWEQIFPEIFSYKHGSYDDRISFIMEGFSGVNLDDDGEFLRAIYGLRSTSWNSYYNLKPDEVEEVDEPEALELLKDLERIYGAFEPSVMKETAVDTLMGLIEDDGAALKKMIEQKAGEGNIKTQNNTQPFRRSSQAQPQPVGRVSKAYYQNLCRSAGVLFDDKEKTDVLADRWKSHLDGTLDDSAYAGFDDCRLLKIEKYPLFGKVMQIRGGKYTLTGNEASDTSLQLRKAVDQVIYAVKQERIVKNLAMGNAQLLCDGCGEFKPSEELHFVPECGHLVCAGHLHIEYCGDIRPCSPTHCPSLLKGSAIPLAKIDCAQRFLDLNIENGRIPQLDKSRGIRSTESISSKSQMIIDTIRRIPEDEYALLFVQFDRQINELIEAFEQSGVSYTTAPVGTWELGSLDGLPTMYAADLRARCSERGLRTDGLVRELRGRLEDWAKGTSRGSAPIPKVRILRLNDSTSAGTNLQYANHVMFASPLLVDVQEEYDAFMKQARGRCVRFGQKKIVQVYHFVTAGTIEVDILELRRQCRILVPPGRAVGRLESHLPGDEMGRGSDCGEDNPARGTSKSSVGRAPTENSSNTATTDAGDIDMPDAPETVISTVPKTAPTETQNSDDKEQRVNSILDPKDIWKAMNEQNWLTMVGIEF
ncbi:hypothetical protein AAE478_006884 [Parahypoxylon ruwenzoriense]